MRGTGVYDRLAYNAVVRAPYVAAGPCHLPRAPPDHPGDVNPAGVWKWLEASPDFRLLLHIASIGASLHYLPGAAWPQGIHENRVPLEYHQEVSRQIADEVSKGWLKEVTATCCPGEVANAPLQVAVEPSKVRRITDYSNVKHGARTGMNSLVDMYSLGDAPMHRPRDLGRAVYELSAPSTPPPLLLVRDVSKAFRRLGVMPSHSRSLRTIWKGKVYEDMRLPFGHAASAHLCCKLTRAIADAVTSHFPGQAKVLAYVDDFILVSRPEAAHKVERVFNQCMSDVGLPMSEAKAAEAGQWSPTATWIGFVHDTQRCTHALVDTKREAMHSEMDLVLKSTRSKLGVPFAQLQSLIGKLSHVASVFTVGRAFLTNLYAVLATGKARLMLTGQAASDLQWWIRALPLLPQKATMRKAPGDNDEVMVTDASLSGQGMALYSGVSIARRALVQDATQAAFGPFCRRGVPGDMMLLEALAAQSAVALWASRFQGKTGYILLDNQPLQFAWQAGRSKSPRVNRVLREILLMLLQHDAQVFPLRVQSSDNKVADALSRPYEPGQGGEQSVRAMQFNCKVLRLNPRDATKCDCFPQRLLDGPQQRQH